MDLQEKVQEIERYAGHLVEGTEFDAKRLDFDVLVHALNECNDDEPFTSDYSYSNPAFKKSTFIEKFRALDADQKDIASARYDQVLLVAIQRFEKEYQSRHPDDRAQYAAMLSQCVIHMFDYPKREQAYEQLFPLLPASDRSLMLSEMFDKMLDEYLRISKHSKKAAEEFAQTPLPSILQRLMRADPQTARTLGEGPYVVAHLLNHDFEIQPDPSLRPPYDFRFYLKVSGSDHDPPSP